MASQPDVLQSCLQAAAKAARPALEQCIEDAVAGLQIAETQCAKVSERDELYTAWHDLQKHKTAWGAQYPADLLVHFKANAAAATLAARSPEAFLEQPAAPAASPGAFAGLTHASLSLVDDSHVSEAIESSRLLQQVLPAVEQTLAELNKLISSVQGLPNVRPDLNPVRPDVFAQTLRELVVASKAEPAIASIWYRYLAAPLGRELKQLYERLINQLELANVQGASYRVLQTPASAGRRTGQGGNGSSHAALGSGSGGEGGFGDGDGGGASPAPPQYADLSNYEIRDELFQEFLFGGGGNAHHGLAPSYYKTVDEELTALKEARDSTYAPPPESRPPGYLSDYQDMPAVDRPQRLVDERSHLDAEVWGSYAQPRERAIVRTQLKKEAQQVGQVLGLEVVRKLVNQVAQDPRLLVPVREAIVALEPSLLRLAMLDPRFFSDEGHAGRRIMERVAQRSFKYNDEFSPEFLAFFEPVTRAFNELNGLTIEDSQPFGMALASLEYGWDEQDQQESENRSNVLHALRFAEERQTQADQIAFELSTRSDLDQVPGLILDFLFGPWALAMAHAKLTDTRNQIDPMGFRSVVPDLLWSVKREVTLKRPAKLIEMIPGLLAKLHEGLALLGQDPRESEPFFEGLMKLHRPVLKLRRLKSRRDAQESGAMPLEPEELAGMPEALPATPEQRRAKAAAHPWLARDELDAAGFEDTLPTGPGELMPLEEEREKLAARQASQATEAAQAANTAAQELDSSHAELLAEQEALASAPPAMAQSEAERLLLSLRSGHWVDLYSRRRWLRAQLIWASTRGTLFMFVSHGGQPHSMTKRSCERLIRDRLLRPVDSHGVVAQALDAVASEAASQTTPASHAEAETA